MTGRVAVGAVTDHHIDEDDPNASVIQGLEAIAFKHEKVASRSYSIKLAKLDPGEYGFLPPGISATSVGASGKMYTFGVPRWAGQK